MFPFPYFNTIQSQAFDAVINSNISVVVSSPTGSGKTAIFELAIIKLLRDVDEGKLQKPKIIYSITINNYSLGVSLQRNIKSFRVL